MITFEDIKNNKQIKTYIQASDDALSALGYTEHSFFHANIVSEKAQYILTELGYPQREIELAKIAGYLHDIGNAVNRVAHAQSGALMAFSLLNKIGMEANEIAIIISAIGNHDEATAFPVNAVAAALILADKTDVRRTRVRNADFSKFDIHDRVNYSVQKATHIIDLKEKCFILDLSIDTNYGSVMDYFEIFIERMILCRKSADKLALDFRLIINGQQQI